VQLCLRGQRDNCAKRRLVGEENLARPCPVAGHEDVDEVALVVLRRVPVIDQHAISVVGERRPGVLETELVTQESHLRAAHPTEHEHGEANYGGCDAARSQVADAERGVFATLEQVGHRRLVIMEDPKGDVARRARHILPIAARSDEAELDRLARLEPGVQVVRQRRVAPPVVNGLEVRVHVAFPILG
jgi:hypothetical protein